MAIHPTAIVDPRAELGEDVDVLPFAIIEGEAQIGDRCVIRRSRRGSQVDDTRRGLCHNHWRCIGEDPQDRKYQGEQTFLRIGRGNEIREYVTMHRASGEGNSTTIGDNNMIMAYCHAGHNVSIGSNVAIANCVQIAGHVVIEDNVVIGGMVGMHQLVTVGTGAMLGAMSRIARDAPPYTIVEGNPAAIRSVNFIGLERRGVSAETRATLRKAFRLLFRSGSNISDALAAIADELEPSPELEYLCDFMRATNQGSMGRQQCKP